MMTDSSNQNPVDGPSPPTDTDTNPDRPVNIQVRASTRARIQEMRNAIRMQGMARLQPRVSNLLQGEWTADAMILVGAKALDILLEQAAQPEAPGPSVAKPKVRKR